MKTTEIEKIASEDRVLTIGKYNANVNFCPFCYPEQVYLGISNLIGFGTDKSGWVVEVSECPLCFKKSHHHLLGIESYETFLIRNGRYDEAKKLRKDVNDE